VPGRALRAAVPIAAIAIAWINAVRPVGVLTRDCALDERAVSAAVALPARTEPITSPLLRSSNRLKPAAIPVIDGCGVFILRRAIVLLFGLGVRRRDWTARRRGEVVALRRPRRARRQAFLLTPPAALIAHLGSLLTLTTRWTGRHSHLTVTH